MRIFYISSLLFTCYMMQAQFAPTAPWMQNLAHKKSTTTGAPKYQDIVTSFNTYWEHRDYQQKGSGYKPFMRWSEFYKNAVLPDGTLPTPNFLWEAWKEKQAMPRNTQKAITDWTPTGPFDHDQASSWSPGQGRINVVVIDPNNTNTLYVGAPAGGIWKSTDNAKTWEPLSDYLPQIGVSGIAIDPNDSNTIYISTGDDDAGDSYGIGVLKSVDGGITWTKTGLTFTDQFSTGNDIYIDPEDSNTLWVATRRGLYKTIDAGKNWKKVLAGNIKDIKLKPGNASIIYAASQSTFYKSTDRGESFIAINEGVPLSSGRLVIDVTPANPEYVYLLSAQSDFSFQGLYKSVDSGSSFVKTAETTNIFEGTQAWYDLALAVSDQDPEMVFVGCINIWKSTDGGNDFLKINRWNAPKTATYTHADIHFLRYQNHKLLCGSDGGAYISDTDGASFIDMSAGLQIGQFYKIAVAENSTPDHLTGGLQDNGGYGLNDDTWHVYYGADGMDCVVTGADANTYYGFIQFGNRLYRTEDRGVTRNLDVFGPEKGEWVTPLVADTNGNIYAGYTSFYKLVNESFVKQTTFDFGGSINCIEVDPTNENIIYAARGKNVYKSTDTGVNWSLLSTQSSNITSIEVHNDDSNIIYMTTSGSVNGRVLTSIDQGVSFKDITGALPEEGKFIVKHHKGTASIYLGTYLGVYHKNGDTPWENYSDKLPSVAVRDLEINLRANILLAGTYGRGIWQVPLAVGSTTDEEAPTAPVSVTAFDITSHTVSLSWSEATDNVAVTGYAIYQDGVQIDTVARTNVIVTGLDANTSYNFVIRAIDAVGNESGDSDPVVVTTLLEGSLDQTAFVVHTIPGLIQAEAYDHGGQDIAYNDFDTTNNGGEERVSESVDIESTTDIGGGTNVGWIMDGEWLEYTIASTETGVYDIDIRVASILSDAKSLQLSLGGIDLGEIDIPNTNGWQNWETISLKQVSITGGANQIVRLTAIGGGFNINYVQFNTIISIPDDSYKFMAKGVSGNEQLTLSIGDTIIDTYTLTTSWEAYTAKSNLQGIVRINFINDDIDRDAAVDFLEKNGQVFQAEDQVINTSVWQNDSCGGANDQQMHCNGYIQFEIDDLGSVLVPNHTIASALPVKEIKKDIQIRPNPTRGKILIDFDTELFSELSIVIFDNLGRMIKNIEIDHHNQQIDLSNYRSGLYFVEIHLGEQVIQKTIVKK